MSRDPLPIDDTLGSLLRALRSAQAAVLEAPPGAGTSTRLACALLEAGWGAEREIWVAQPQSLAAQLAAESVARQLGESVGQRVGCQLRFEQRAGPETRLRFVTDGVLLERLSSAERGTGIGLVVLDEFHERRVATDLSLMLSRRRLKADAGLRIVVISSLYDTASVATYLGDCPRLRCSDSSFPVQIEHAAACEEQRPLQLRLSAAVERLVRAAPRGDILTFLPGVAEIERAEEALRALATELAVDLIPLHGELPPELAARATSLGPRRKVILATSLAESLLVQGVTAVVDSGLARSAEYSPWTHRPNLELRPISQACATRRADRAGLAESGHVLRLYTEASLLARPEQQIPELRRLDLTGPLLTLYACKVPLTPELWLDAPSDAALGGARAQLARLGLASGDRVTDLGRRASALPVPPRLARVALEGAELGIPRRVCLAVALLAEQDLRQDTAASGRGLTRAGHDCDIEHLIASYAAAEADRFAPAALRQLGLRPERVDTVRRSYERLLGNLTARNPVADEDTLDAASTRRALGIALLAGFPERVAGRRGPGENELLLSTEHEAELAPESVARSSPFLLAVDAEERRGPADRVGPGAPRLQLRVRVASPIEASWLIDHAPEGLSDRELLDWDDEREQAILISQLCWGAVVLHESVRPASPGIATGVLVERAALEQLATLFVEAETLPELVSRSELVDQYLPELGLQPVNELGTRGLLRAACTRVISLAELRELDWGAVFLEQLTPEQRRELERQAPQHIVLTGGRRLQVQYARGQAPSVEARLQDFFGMEAGPAILNGRLPLRLHLLAPNQRAVQVTADLAAFWERDYAGLRRELSRRYPRDAWPEEPRTATAPLRHEPR